MSYLDYPDTATIIKVSSEGYGNNKVVVDTEDVPVIFVQNTQFRHINYQDLPGTDALCWPDPSNSFLIENDYQLEGMYLHIPLFGAEDDEGWYRITDCTINRDHLLENEIDNVELRLQKTSALPGVS